MSRALRDARRALRGGCQPGDLLRWEAEDASGTEIAAALYLSVNTVRSHIKAIYRKLGVNSRADAVRVARSVSSEWPHLAALHRFTHLRVMPTHPCEGFGVDNRSRR